MDDSVLYYIVSDATDAHFGICEKCLAVHPNPDLKIHDNAGRGYDTMVAAYEFMVGYMFSYEYGYYWREFNCPHFIPVKRMKLTPWTQIKSGYGQLALTLSGWLAYLPMKNLEDLFSGVKEVTVYAIKLDQSAVSSVFKELEVLKRKPGADHPTVELYFGKILKFLGVEEELK